MEKAKKYQTTLIGVGEDHHFVTKFPGSTDFARSSFWYE
jgi:6-phosphogluconolactonase/glucosamine-6-phosphate isomerase/deaminase